MNIKKGGREGGFVAVLLVSDRSAFWRAGGMIDPDPFFSTEKLFKKEKGAAGKIYPCLIVHTFWMISVYRPSVIW